MIIERYQRSESAVGAALIEMSLAGVSVRRVEDITEALWGSRVSPGTVSSLNSEPVNAIRPRERANDLRRDRRMAAPADRRGTPVCLA